MSLLTGRLALVTGGGSGLGKAISKVLAREGARVVVSDLNVANCQETIKEMQGSDHLPLEIDVARQDSVQAVAEEISKRFQCPADILVNSAGITRDGYLLKMTEQAFDQVIAVNLKGTFNTNQVLGKAMKTANISNGSIVNISSVIGLTGNKGQTNYAASKAGVIAFTKSAAKELGQFGIRVNCICPGFIETPMASAVPEHLQQMIKFQIPSGKFGHPEDVAELAAFLASDKSSYINGAEIKITGGLF